MIDVEKRTLRPLKENTPGPSTNLVQQVHHIADKGLQTPPKSKVFVEQVVETEGLCPVPFHQHAVFFWEHGLKSRSEPPGRQQVADPDATARDFVLVAWTNAPLSGTDLLPTGRSFSLLIEYSVVREDYMRSMRYKELTRPNR
jgi:hypothetical protein